MMDIYDDRFKDVCEPENNDSSSPTSTIVEEFESLVGEIIKQKEEVKEISDPVARRRDCFAKLKNFRIIHQGRVIHSPQIASVGADKSKISRKQSKTRKHGHENQKSTKPKPKEAKPQPNP
ncbi:hypothetical protein Tco_1162433 [Tanacetum coccineum]